MARIVRPVEGRLEVELPYMPAGGNYALLHEICGERTRPKWNPELRAFEVARQHLEELIATLAGRIGAPVEVVLLGSLQKKCVLACWAADPNTRWDCVCSCAGSNHGSGQPLAQQVGSDLSLATEYTSQSYFVYP